MHTCRPPCPRALQPHGKCENGLRSGPYVLAAARWPWQIVQEMRACRRRAMRRGANHANLQAAMSTRLATARQVRKRFTIWALRLGVRALAWADRPRHASMSPAHDAPRGTEKRSQPCGLASRNARAPCNREASAKTVYDLGPTSWRPCAGLGRSSKKCEHVAGARRAKGHGEAEPTMQTCKPQCPRALHPHGKCKNG